MAGPHAAEDGWILVTGASSGIGLELARLLAADGKDLILVARREERLAQLASELTRTHDVQVRTQGADLAQPGEGAALVRRLSAPIAHLVNNAGVGQWGAFAECDPEGLRQMLRLNVEALTELTRAVLPGMIERRRGSVLQVASTASFQPGPWMAAYYATKAYVLSLSEALAIELEGTGVTMHTLCPGPTRSEFQKTAGMGSSGILERLPVQSAAAVARSGYRAWKRGKRVIVTGWTNRLGVLGASWLPRRWSARLAGKVQASR